MIALQDGCAAEVLDEVDSTNREAARRSLLGEAGPVWIFARMQTAGRGRQGRVWASPEGNLYGTHLSLLTEPAAHAALAGFAAALAVADTFSNLAPAADVKLKWPNDVLLNNAKASGILLETCPGPLHQPQRLSIGIGLNLAFAPPADQTRWRATSLKDELGVAPDFDKTANLLAASLAQWLKRLKTKGFEPIRDAWLARAAHLGHPIEARLPNESLHGRFADLDHDGALVIDTDAGMRRVAAGDVFLPGVG